MLVKLKEALEALARQMKCASFHTSLREGGGGGLWGLGIITVECFTTSVKFASAIKCNLHVFITSMGRQDTQAASLPPSLPLSPPCQLSLQLLTAVSVVNDGTSRTSN